MGKLLSHDEILQLHAAVISARLVESRAALLAGVDGGFVASLPHAFSPSDQILRDLDALNAVEKLANGGVPLAVWLTNAAALAGARSEGAVFRRALSHEGPIADAMKTTTSCDIASGAPVKAFELIHGITQQASLSDAATLVGLSTMPSPFREVLVFPLARTGRVLAAGGIARTATECQIWTQHNREMYPMLNMRQLPERREQGLLWTVDEQTGYWLRFAMGFDGSFAYREWMRESYLNNSVWGSGVGLFTCLDRVIGGLLFARRLLYRVPGIHRMQTSILLEGIAGRDLAFDFEDHRTVRMIQLDRGKFVCQQDAVRVDGCFDPEMDDADIMTSAASVGEALSYYFGWDWQEAVVRDELRSILSNARNREPGNQ